MAPVPTAHVLRELGRPDRTEEEKEAVAGLHPAEQRYRVLFLRYLDSLPAEVAIDMDRIGTVIADYVEETQVATQAQERGGARAGKAGEPAGEEPQEATRTSSGSWGAALRGWMRALDDRSRDLFARVPAWLAVVLVVTSLVGLAAVLWWRAGGWSPAVVDPPVSVPVEAPAPWAPPSGAPFVPAQEAPATLPEPKKK